MKIAIFVTPDLFRHPPFRRHSARFWSGGTAERWTPEQVRGDI